MKTAKAYLTRLTMEPPFRLVTRAILKRLSVSARTRSIWELSDYPAYFMGVFAAAEIARQEDIESLLVIEFGVAGGNGLLALEEAAEAIGRESGIEIRAVGFDNGSDGLPSLCGDYRDHPDQWQPGDYPMNVQELQAKLDQSTQLILGNVRDTVPDFVSRRQDAPVGFVSFDLDLYSSTKDALSILASSHRNMLRQVPLYFDDIDFIFNNRFSGELLAIEEFNTENDGVKIDRWYGVTKGRPFPERDYLSKMYVAHDLAAISRSSVSRDFGELPLRQM